MTGPSTNHHAHHQVVPFGNGISNARSLASLPQVATDHPHAGANGIIAGSTSVGDLNTSEESSDHPHNRAKPILKKDSKYGSRRELPALGVSGMVMAKTRPSVFEFWENMVHHPAQSAPTAQEPDVNCASRSSMRRVLPSLPGQPSSLTVHTNGSITPASEMVLGSRGEVEGSSNQPSPTCLAGEIDPAYWNHQQPTSLPVTKHDQQIIDDLNRTKKQLAELQNLVSPSFYVLIGTPAPPHYRTMNFYYFLQVHIKQMTNIGVRNFLRYIYNRIHKRPFAGKRDNISMRPAELSDVTPISHHHTGLTPIVFHNEQNPKALRTLSPTNQVDFERSGSVHLIRSLVLV